MNHDHPFGKAILYTMVLCAAAHLALSFFYAALYGDADVANMFHVLGFDLFWPELGKGTVNGLLGVGFIVVSWAIVGGVLQWRNKREDKKHDAAKKPKGRK